MKSFRLKVLRDEGYLPYDGEKVLIDGQEYEAREERRESAGGFWDGHCAKCAFGEHRDGVDGCYISCTQVLRCFGGGRYIWFKKTGRSASDALWGTEEERTAVV